MHNYSYEYLKLAINTSPDELDAAINEVAQRGLRLVQVIPNYTYFKEVELPEDGSKIYRAEEMLVIFEKAI